MGSDTDATPHDAIDGAWQEHQQRVANGKPYTDPVTNEEIAERLRELAATGRYVPFAESPPKAP